MNARQRFNQYYLTIAIVLASFIGLTAGSWLVFGVSAVILIILNLIGGAIRLGGPRRMRFRGPRFRARRYA
jgi:diacylglycerol kinase